MSQRLRKLFVALALVPVSLAVAASWHLLLTPKARPVSSRVHVPSTPERLARGEYLGRRVTACFHCHSEVDPDRLGAPPKPAVEGKGRVFPLPDLRGPLVAGNLTPDESSGLGGWTDDELLRALREGIDRSGRALHPAMPYETFRSLSDDDAQALVAFLRSLPPARTSLPSTRLNARTRFAISGIPTPLKSAVPPPEPGPGDATAQGRYLATIARCLNCHSCADHAPAFIDRMSREGFIARFRSMGSFPRGQEPLVSHALNTPMPWTALGGMSEDDLGAIHDYLKSVATPTE